MGIVLAPRFGLAARGHLVTGALDEWSSRGFDLGQNPAYRPPARKYRFFE